MIGSLISAGLSVAGGIAGGIMSSNAAKKAKGMVEQQRAANQAWYERKYNEDATQRADALRAYEMAADELRRRNKAAAGTAAVMGATTETVAAEKAASSQALADVVSQIAANGERSKEVAEQQYRQADAGYAQQLTSLEQQRSQAVADAVKGIGQSSGALGGAINGFMDSKK